MPEPCLVFDLGGVLIDVAPAEETIAGLAAASATPVERLRGPLREAFTQRPYSLAERFQAGEVDAGAFLAELDAMLERPLGPEQLRRAVEAMLRAPVPETPALLDELAARYRVACFSNTNPIHWRHALERFGFMQRFQPRLASHEVGLVKPDPRVFDRVQTQLGVAAGDCVLIDDRAINVDAARSAGWTGLQFTGVTQLRVDLDALGIAA